MSSPPSARRAPESHVAVPDDGADRGEPRSEPEYDELLQIGEGGMARVLLALPRGKRALGDLVVLKRLHAYLREDDDALRRLVVEARIAASVAHENVVSVRRVVDDGRERYLVLDYVEGATLGELVERAIATKTALPPSVVSRVVCDVLAGLHAAHEACGEDGKPLAVLHRDVSPHNVLVGVDGTSRLTDFGVAKALAAKGMQARTGEGVLVGKLMFMAPEYLRAEPHDRRADVYSAGITAWCAYARRAPFASRGESDLVAQILSAGAPALPHEAGVDASLAAVLARACALDAAARFATAGEAGAAFAAAAREGNGLASRAEVGAFVRALFGDDFAARERALRARIAELRPPLPPAGSARPSAPAGASRSRAAWSAVAAAIVLALAVTAWSAARRAPAAAPAPSSAAPR